MKVSPLAVKVVLALLTMLNPGKITWAKAKPLAKNVIMNIANKAALEFWFFISQYR